LLAENKIIQKYDPTDQKEKKGKERKLIAPLLSGLPPAARGPTPRTVSTQKIHVRTRRQTTQSFDDEVVVIHVLSS
jgi:hypothetical protein